MITREQFDLACRVAFKQTAYTSEEWKQAALCHVLKGDAGGWLAYCEDNLKFMEKMPDECVDLIYLDPPFFTQKNFSGYAGSTAEFSDKWSSENEYISFMRERIVEMRRILSSKGSIYLHVDSIMSHYLKIVLDEVFGRNNFRREIIWANNDSSGLKSVASNWIRGHDVILYYLKSKDFVFNKEYRELKPQTIKCYNKTDENGDKYMIRKRKHGEVRCYLKDSKGVALGSVWDDIHSFQTASGSKEIVGYPTQKPLALLERIIRASSNERDLVFDPFCGSGTTLVAAKNLNRRYIGCDKNSEAIDTAQERLSYTAHNSLSEVMEP